ncbi:MAG: hypothetical protein J0I75_12470 [Hyphomicrobium sp.]|nr:hypothetical protein [Hyphomicrobium sp.]
MSGKPFAALLLRAAAVTAAAGLAITAAPLWAAEFTYNEKTNQDMARRLDMPVYLAVPASARLTLPKSINTTDRLVEFKHPDAKGAQGDVGLRLVVAKRAGFGQRMAKSGLIQTGDIILTFRPERGGGGAYPNIPMGVSHTGIAYVQNGVARQLDIPLNAEYLGGNYGGNFDSEHYRTLKYIHIIRPRGLTDAQRAAILAWATRINQQARKIYPSQISFNDDYNAPKYRSGRPLDFVQHLARLGLGQNPPGQTSMFCSEFVWSVLALRNCDPAKTGDSFKTSRIPSCVSPIMEPLPATGTYMSTRTSRAKVGLGEGPLMVIDALKLPAEKRDALVNSIFVEDPKATARMSSGHQTIAKTMAPRFMPLKDYYRNAAAGGWRRAQTLVASTAFRSAVPDNYSPTSYLINTTLPRTNRNRTMDYVATVMFE